MTKIGNSVEPKKDNQNGCLLSESATIPEISEKRRRTDTPFLILFGAFLLLLIPLSSIFSVGSDLNRFFYGYDKCGNTCGVKNAPIHGLNCSGKDMTGKNIALMRYQAINKGCIFSKYKVLAHKCVERCDPPYQKIFQRCYPSCRVVLDEESKTIKQLTEVLHIFDKSLTTIMVMCFTGLVITFGIFICFRCHAEVTFWTLVIFQLTVLMTLAMFLWQKYMTSENYIMIYLVLALITSGYLLFLIFFIICLHSTFTLIFKLYEEALNAMFQVPFILTQPILTFFGLLLVLVSMMYLMFLVSSNEYLIPVDEEPYTFKYVSRISGILFAFYIFVMTIWLYGFIDGCQSMLLSGAVAKFYYAKQKNNLHSPYYHSFLILKRHHLGTVACGSMVSTLMIFLKGIPEYFINHAYILTAMHGTSLYKSSVRAIKLLGSNLTNTIAIAGINYIVVNGFSVVATMVSIIVGVWMNATCDFSYYYWMGILIGAVASSSVTYVALGTMMIATETVFLCFCEDQLSNDKCLHHLRPELVKLIKVSHEAKNVSEQI